MTPFHFRAARADGGIVEGLVDASSAGQASAVVTDRGLFPLDVTPAEAVDRTRRPASRRDLAIVFQSIRMSNFSTWITTGGTLLALGRAQPAARGGRVCSGARHGAWRGARNCAGHGARG